MLHQWSVDTENCIVIIREGETGKFGIFIGALGGYQEWISYPAGHLISIGIRPEHEPGDREYNEIYFWVWDRTGDEFWGKSYVLPETEEIKAIDAALEQNKGEVPNGFWKNFHKFSPIDEDPNDVDLEANFEWKEWWWSCRGVNNEHAEDYYHNYKCYACDCSEELCGTDECPWYEVPCDGPPILSGIISDLFFPPPSPTQPPEFENIELKVGESAVVHGHTIRIFSIEREVVKMEVLNETTGESIPVTFDVEKGGTSFKYKNISFAPVKVEGENVTVSILEVAFREGEG